MALKLNKSGEAFWVNVEGGDFLVRPLALSEENRLRKKNTRIKRGMEQLNHDHLFRDRFDQVVRDWQGVEINGDTAPECSRENKDWICEHFTSLASDIMNRAEEEGNDTQEADNRNLSE